MRAVLALLLVSLVLVGCGGAKTRTVTVTQPAATVTAPATTTAPSSTSPATQPDAGGVYRKPKPGETQSTITGRVARGTTVKGPGGGDTSVFTTFEVQPDDGGQIVRVAAAGDLALDPKVRAALVDPRCGGKLHGTFVVVPAGRRSSGYEWELIRADVPARACGRA